MFYQYHKVQEIKEEQFKSCSLQITNPSALGEIHTLYESQIIDNFLQLTFTSKAQKTFFSFTNFVFLSRYFYHNFVSSGMHLWEFENETIFAPPQSCQCIKIDFVISLCDGLRLILQTVVSPVHGSSAIAPARQWIETLARRSTRSTVAMKNRKKIRTNESPFSSRSTSHRCLWNRN